MKTTIEIADATFAEAKRVAEREGTTLRALVEEGLRHAIATRRARRTGFKLRRVTVKGEGISPDFAAGWSHLRDEIYRGHGA